MMCPLYNSSDQRTFTETTNFAVVVAEVCGSRTTAAGRCSEVDDPAGAVDTVYKVGSVVRRSVDEVRRADLVQEMHDLLRGLAAGDGWNAERR